MLKNKLLLRQFPLHLMMIPGVAMIFVFHYIPITGLVIAFQKYIPGRNMFFSQRWVGWDNFKYVMEMPDIYRVIGNTLYISVLKICFSFLVPIVIAILINEVRQIVFKRTVQTLVYIPHFLSWVVLGGILIDILSPSTGIIGQLLSQWFGVEPIFFLGSNSWFPITLVATDVWKEFGFGTILFLAAITGIDPQLYDSALVDGANRWQRIWHITLPGMIMIIVLVGVLKLGGVLNAGFEQVYNLYNPAVYQSGDIIDTLSYRIGIGNAQYSVATAIGLFKSVISGLLVSVTYYCAYRFANYRIF
ncbi:MAG: protein lplB [Paenibacillaceae bacterium]|nr:protein lplB [Paenibacillaceae bacterium]